MNRIFYEGMHHRADGWVQNKWNQEQECEKSNDCNTTYELDFHFLPSLFKYLVKVSHEIRINLELTSCRLHKSLSFLYSPSSLGCASHSDVLGSYTAMATKIRPYIYRINNLKIFHLKK